jgi:DNA-directed RNA polymerase subunit RPC12/RpoP
MNKKYYCYNCRKTFEDQLPVEITPGSSAQCPECLMLSRVEEWFEGIESSYSNEWLLPYIENDTDK